jgi:predicted GIY-YIG superfamily endonuclease
VTELYRHFDSENRLLYVGISLSTASRLSQHSDYSHWFKDITKVTIERYATREEAKQAEKAAIWSEKPQCNIQLQKSIKDIEKENLRLQKSSYANMTETSRKNLTGRIVQFGVCYSIKEIQELLGMTSAEINMHVERGNLHYFEIQGQNVGRWPVKMHKKVTGWQFINFMEFLQNKGTT